MNTTTAHVDPREIPKQPQVPKLSSKLIDLITELCFRSDANVLKNIDTIFVFGTIICEKLLSEIVIEHTNNLQPRNLIIAGGAPTYIDSTPSDEPEADKLFSYLFRKLPNNTNILLERNSNNILENVQNPFMMLEKKNIKNLLFIAKNFAAGRCYLTIKKTLPKTTIFQKSFEAIYPNSNIPIKADNWHCYPSTTSRVFGEYLRIKNYSARGDIHYQEVKSLINKIDILLKNS